jgi:hypothetical protein
MEKYDRKTTANANKLEDIKYYLFLEVTKQNTLMQK